jgi:transcriptional regulator with PAS, ATPase and Fis domain
MPHHPWVEELPVAVTICDEEGIILEMNEKAAKTFEAEGGRALVGRNVLDCHPGSARAKLQQVLAEGKTNVYTIEKRGVKKLVYQSPWYEEGRYRGFAELVLEVPYELPHFVRS